MAASAFALYAMAFSVEEARKILRVAPQTLIGMGLLLALGSGLVSLFGGMPFMTGRWQDVHVPGMGVVHLGTPMFFDIGVYLDVLGATLLIIFTLADHEQEEDLEYALQTTEGED